MIAFPPNTHKRAAEVAEEPDIRDPWSGPQTYAEDFYSGGDRPLRHGHPVDAHHIEDGEEEVDGEDEEGDGEEDMDEDAVDDGGRSSCHPCFPCG